MSEKIPTNEEIKKVMDTMSDGFLDDPAKCREFIGKVQGDAAVAREDEMSLTRYVARAQKFVQRLKQGEEPDPKAVPEKSGEEPVVQKAPKAAKEPKAKKSTKAAADTATEPPTQREADVATSKKVKPSKKKAAAVKGKKAANGAGRKSQRGEQIITILADANPKRKGTTAFDAFAKYKNGMTVAAALEKGIPSAYITWDADHKFIKLSGK